MSNLILAEHTNSEYETLTIEEVTDGQFRGQQILVIHDDPPGRTKAPMLLDDGTRKFLLNVLRRSDV